MEPPTPQNPVPAHPSAADDTTTPDESDEADETDAGTLGEAHAHRPVHLHPGFVLVVVGGGTVGALARYGLSVLLPSPAGWPLPTLITNVTGAFLLGVLLEALVRSGPDTGRRRLIRLLAGTGFLGAFTTYSALALETNTLVGDGRPIDALLYASATLVAGTIATVAGIAAASGHHARRTSRRWDAATLPGQRDGR